MRTQRQRVCIFLVILTFLWIIPIVRASDPSPSQGTDPLPSWNNTATKKAIIAFVDRVTKEDTPDYIPPAERIATFDNDGTLWAEQPMYFPWLFAVDRLKALAPSHPEWRDKEPFASALRGDLKSLSAGGGYKAMDEIVMATHTGMTTGEFDRAVKDWIAVAKHPKTNRFYTEMVYQPMIEFLAYLREKGFKTFIVSGGAMDFMRPWAEKTYGIPPEQVVGSTLRMNFEIRNGKPALIPLPRWSFIDDGTGKPVGIHYHIGRRPAAAFGNSDGDREMLQWTQAGGGMRLMVLVHHDDSVREWAYGANSKIGTFSDSLMTEAKKNGWVVISMKEDWKRIFVFEKAE
jgi:phosphoglycolate phosphatase-like HAD superfamily hydrolase